VPDQSAVAAAPFAAEEVSRLRADTPGCAHVIHFNHCGSSLMPRPVIDATVGHIQREATIGGYEAADEAEDRIEVVYASAARLIGAAPDEIAFVENATRGWDMAFYAIPLQAGDRILTSVAEYGSNALAFLQVAQRGVSVEVVPNDEQGQIDVAALARLLDDRVRVVALSHMPTNGGLVQPAAAVGRLAREAGAISLLDACQTAGQLPLDVDALNCDVLAATSRKFLRGPRGMGFLYVRRNLCQRLHPPFVDIRAATWAAPDRYDLVPGARRFENWESNVAGKLGMGAAIDYALDLGLDRIWATVAERATTLRDRLAAIPGVTVRDLGAVKGGIVTFEVAGVAPRDVRDALHADRINTTVSGISSTRWDMTERGIDRLCRASVHYLTTDDEIDALVAGVARIAGAG
jgi:selenocysteine lyase/cysteine desulfurase